MRVTETLIKKNNLAKENRKKSQNSEPDHLEMNKIREANKGQYFNSPSMTLDSKLENGINAQQSIFNTQAMFRTTDRG
jgi:hypothetical protein